MTVISNFLTVPAQNGAMKPDGPPRPEHPRPQFERGQWRCLNGAWSCLLDFGRSGIERGFRNSTGFSQTITVPFCPESPLSGLQYTDFIEVIWYHRKLTIPEEWHGRRIFLHFGAVDYEAEIYIDGALARRHFGGSVSFSCDITAQVAPGHEHDLVVRASDNPRSRIQPGGKQSLEYASAGCMYTRTTGIWQTVWMEAADPFGLQAVTIVPDFDGNAFTITPHFFAQRRGDRLRIRLFRRDNVVADSVFPALHGIPCRLMPAVREEWHPDHPELYDITFDVVSREGSLGERVQSYAGLRKIHVEGNRLYLNNRPLYLRMVLDQGYYEQGIWTAPSDADLRRDIELGLQAGFNGARLHQKVFEERYHYWADRLGYLTWGESASWGFDLHSDAAARNFVSEWREIVERDRNHPSIIAWTPLNETWDISNPRQHERLHREVYQETRRLDPTRPVNTASGGCELVTDLYAVHVYEQDPLKLDEKLRPGPDGELFRTMGEKDGPYEGQPYMVDEFGGIKWVSEQDRAAAGSWGYGEAPRTEQDFFSRLSGQVQSVLKQAHVSGYCYTQLTDVEQEQNGLYYYDRRPKFDCRRLREIFSREPNSDREAV